MNITKTIVRIAAPYAAVAFDVFDTLIKRDVAKPTDLFRLEGDAFAQARIRAEQQAREQSGGEITLAQIYEQPDMEAYDPARECARELSACVPNLPVQRAVQKLRAQGKHIYFVSDMYLPPEQITAMLTHCGYEPFDGGFVSSSYGVQKRSGGLFRRFLRETGLHAKEVLFIGDSLRADIVGAALAGIRAWRLPVPVLPDVPFPQSAVAAFVSNRLDGLPSQGEKLGFSVLGALEIAFCRWIHEQRKCNPEGRVYFLARDMYLTRAVYHCLYPAEETFYLEVSRRSLCPWFLKQGKYALLAQALPRQQLSGAQIADYCGVVCPTAFSQKKFDLKSCDTATALYEMFAALQPPEQAGLVQTYLHESGIRDGDFLVDIGSGGTTQLLLQQLLGIRLHGLQLSGDDRLRDRLASEQVSVFLSLEQDKARLYWVGQPMLERLISQDIGATVGYFRKADGTIAVRRGTQREDARIAAVQRGILRFAEAWQTSILRDLPFAPQAAIQPFLQMVRAPAVSQVSFLGSICVEDGGVYPLADPKGLGRYLLHPAQLKGDLSAARWKIGFLKKLCPMPVPYDRLYLGMKK